MRSPSLCALCNAAQLIDAQVYRGELQCRMLGMAIECFNEQGQIAAPNEEGDLVCTRPFPCMVRDLPCSCFVRGLGVDILRAARLLLERSDVQQVSSFIFRALPWCLGSRRLLFVHRLEIALRDGDDRTGKLTPSRQHNGGGLVMLGRSDGVLNPQGVSHALVWHRTRS